jgi:hypothetical protein
MEDLNNIILSTIEGAPPDFKVSVIQLDGGCTFLDIRPLTRKVTL